jgi:hypothetical protein
MAAKVRERGSVTPRSMFLMLTSAIPDFWLGRVLISAQIAAGCALTLRLRHGDAFLRLRLRLSKK